MFLTYNDHLVGVTPQGGSVTDWLWRGKRILGPVRQDPVGQSGLGAPIYKRRGVTHWCFPNFGHAPATEEWRGHPDHGHLRDTQLTTTRMTGQDAQFSGLVHNGRLPSTNVVIGAALVGSRIQGGAELTMWLTATISDVRAEACIPVLPGLHLYFFSSEGSMTVDIGGRMIEYGPDSVKTQHAGSATVHLPFGDVLLRARACNWFVTWSDDPTRYGCVEPVFGEPGTFATDSQENFLTPTQPVNCLVTMLFVPR